MRVQEALASLRQVADTRSLRAVDELLMAREAELVEELLSDADASACQKQLQEVRKLRDLLKSTVRRNAEG